VPQLDSAPSALSLPDGVVALPDGVALAVSLPDEVPLTGRLLAVSSLVGLSLAGLRSAVPPPVWSFCGSRSPLAAVSLSGRESLPSRKSR
jgi:hypothetical protein